MQKFEAYDEIKDCVCKLRGIEQILGGLVIAESVDRHVGDHYKEMHELLDYNMMELIGQLCTVLDEYFNA